MRFATQEEIDIWDELITHNPDGGTLCQMREYAATKQSGGWQPRYIRHDNLAILILEKSVPSIGELWYIPKGPGVINSQDFDKLIPSLQQFAKAEGIFVVRIEPDFSDDTYETDLRRTRTIQANASTIIMDISTYEDELMALFESNCRSAIHHAERAGVVIMTVTTSEANCQTMYHLLGESAAGRTKTRPYNYYRTFWQSFAASGHGQLFFAYYDGQIVAGCFIVTIGTKAFYKDGGSVRTKPTRGVSNILQWEAIRWAKNQGATIYDMYGATRSTAINNPNEPYFGITQFKLGFGGKLVDSVGCFDLIIKPTPYKMWCNFGESVVRKTTKLIKQSYWY